MKTELFRDLPTPKPVLLVAFPIQLQVLIPVAQATKLAVIQTFFGHM